MKTNKLANNSAQAEMLQAAAAELLKPLLYSGPPYDPFLIASGLRVPVTETSIHGALGYVDNRSGSPRIFLEKNLSVERKRFTLAHELGHVMLMRLARAGTNVNLVRYRKSGCPPGMTEDPAEEALCNLFAAELLMPSWEVRDVLRERAFALDSIFTVKNRFQVSLQAAATKLIKLGQWSQLLSISQWDCNLTMPTSKWRIGSRRFSNSEFNLIRDFVTALDHRSHPVEISIGPPMKSRGRHDGSALRAGAHCEVRVLHRRGCTLVFVCAPGWKDRPTDNQTDRPTAITETSVHSTGMSQLSFRFA